VSVFILYGCTIRFLAIIALKSGALKFKPGGLYALVYTQNSYGVISYMLRIVYKDG
jgi:hypothetical protein